MKNYLWRLWFSLEARIERTTNRATLLIIFLQIVFLIMPFFQVFIGLCLVWVFKECLKLVKKWFSKGHRQLEKFNGPRSYPVIGTVLDMIFTDFWTWGNKMCKKYGDPVRFWRFGHPMVFISTYEYAIQLLSRNEFNGKLKDLEMFYRQRGGSGLSTTPADKHPQKRKMLTPAFSRQVVEGSLGIFCEETIALLDKLERFANSGEEFDMIDPMMKCLFRMVLRSDFGDIFIKNKDDTFAQAHMEALHTIANNMSKRMFSPYPWVKNDFIYFNLTVEGKETIKARDTLNSFAVHAIQGRRQHRSTNRFKPETLPRCYLDVLLDLVDQNQMRYDDVISELNNFMGGAYDTTALAVCWTLLLLALNPECQNKLYKELQDIFQEFPSTTRRPKLTPVDTKRMKYLELCLKESLRLFPPAPIFPRSTVVDMKLDDGRIIPGGADVLIFSNLIHRDPKHFPEPDKFLPEREKEPNPAFMPFSLGVRGCIGQTYGMYQSKVVLAYLCHEYFWETNVTKADDVRIKYQGLLYPEDGLHFKIKRRSGDNGC